ncbi:hypothetical protein DK412_04745 [Methylobacterium sp. 17Sr1-1]|nr:hypothetical protein DK412_04745 [Methylobacterium sp. 17Sr1-1]
MRGPHIFAAILLEIARPIEFEQHDVGTHHDRIAQRYSLCREQRILSMDVIRGVGEDFTTAFFSEIAQNE